ncbi:MAG: T9SS type A sorting domain-containing protein, partial [Bacteroidota bacterium]
IVKTVTVNTTSTIVKLGLSTKYYWRVQAFDNNLPSPISAIDSFRTIVVPCTVTPTQLLPAVNSTTVPAKNATLFVSYVSTASTYHFQVDTVNKYLTRDTATIAANKYTGAFVVNDSTSDSDTMYTFAATLKPSKMYYWRARGYNPAGSSNWSPVDSFTVMFLPVAPALVYPTVNQANVSVSPSLTLKWNHQAGDSNYVVQLWTYTSVGKALMVDTTKHDTSWTIPGLASRVQYFWNVQCYNQGGFGPVSAIDSFTTVIEMATAPNGITPKNTTAEPRKTKFVWSKSPTAVWYHLQVATTNFANPSDIVEDVTVQMDTSYTIKDTLAAATLYYWHVSSVNLAGESVFSTSAHFTTGTTVGVVEANNEVPQAFTLMQNYPNPFNPSTTISYDLPKTSVVKLYIYDVLGRIVANLVDGVQSANRYRIEWNPSRLSSGVYFCRIQAHSQDGSADFTSVKKLLYMK